MSITIHHLEGRFADQDRTFPATADTIVFGRAADCDVVYPAQYTDIADRHLKITRSASGTFQVHALSTQSVEVDGKTVTKADGPVEVDFGSTIRLAEDGPAFRFWLLTLTIRHLTGPLAGQSQSFDNSHEVITFGRAPENDVVFPAKCETVGRRHFLFGRNWFGAYDIEFSDDHYVSVDGKPLRYGFNKQIRSGAVLRLGSRQGPSFRVEWDDARNPAGPAKTKFNEYVDSAEHALERNKRWIVACMALLLVALAGFGAFEIYRETRLSSAIADLERNVYLVVKDDAGVPVAQATAFVVGPYTLATNAHVTLSLRNARPGEYYLVGPDNERIEIATADSHLDVTSHPGYAAFEAEKHTFGTRRNMSFEPLDLPSGYDVGLIEIDHSQTPLSGPSDPALELASGDEVEDLAPGTELVSAGFPQEGLKGTATSPLAPAVKIAEGIVRAVVDVFQGKPENPEQGLIILHDIPVAGGASGSPIVDLWTGKVVAIVSGGNIVALKGDDEGSLGNAKRTPSAALVNFAHRVDVLQDLLDDGAAEALAEDQKTYWEQVAESRSYDRYAVLVHDLFMSEARRRYAAQNSDAGSQIGWAQGLLIPGQGLNLKALRTAPPTPDETPAPLSLKGKDSARPMYVADTYELSVEPGYGYGLLVETSGIPGSADPGNLYADPVNITILPNDKLLAQPQASDPNLARVAWASVSEPTTLQIRIGGFMDRSAPYTLHVFSWKLPPPVLPATSAVAP